MQHQLGDKLSLPTQSLQKQHPQQEQVCTLIFGRVMVNAE